VARDSGAFKHTRSVVVAETVCNSQCAPVIPMFDKWFSLHAYLEVRLSIMNDSETSHSLYLGIDAEDI
jgi:hypothetical protein